MDASKRGPARTLKRDRPLETECSDPRRTIALRIAEGMGLLSGPKTKHFNAKVPPKLFQAAARRVGTTSPAAVINAALAALATEDQLGPWLAKNWGVLSDTPSELLDQLDL